jgi:cytochrome P450
MDIVKMFNFATFDIMGDLTFGEPLGMLENSKYTPWVSTVFKSLKASGLLHLPTEYSVFQLLFNALSPKWMDEMRKSHFQHAADRVDLRLAKGDITEKPDIWSLVLEKGRTLSIGQMHANASLFMLAGTETTATLMSGLTYQFLKNPDKLKKAVDEVRALPADGLTLEQLPRLEFLNACFEEAFRMYPPVPVGFPRAIPKGGNVVCGDWLPEGVRLCLFNSLTLKRCY